jgi:hypothetical protein
MPAGGMQSVSLVKPGEAVVTNQQVDGQSAVVATSGLLDYSSIEAYVARQFSTNPALSEDASVAVYNASDAAGVASSLASKLEAQGFNVTATGDASASDANGHYTIYDTTGGQKPGTMKYLLSKLNGAVVSRAAAPNDIAGSADIIIVIGSSSGN